MFSGIISLEGRVKAWTPHPSGGGVLRIAIGGVPALQTQLGDSIAIDGVCLTLTARGGDVFAFDVVPETLSRTTLGGAAAGRKVNCELSLRLGDRLGGHLVYGHVDAVSEVVDVVDEGIGRRVTFRRPPELARFIVEKGYVALDGVSLTVAGVSGETFAVAVIPETLRRTTLGERTRDAEVNLEIDPVARYALGAASAYGA